MTASRPGPASSVRRLFTQRRDAAAGIYGTIVATSIVAGLSETNELRPSQAVEVLLGSQIVLWLSHVYARYLARKADPDAAGLDAATIVGIALYEWPMLRACLPALVAVGLWWLGALSAGGAYWLALVLGVGELAALGFTFGRRVGQSVLLAAGTAVLDGSLGVLIVLVKVLAG